MQKLDYSRMNWRRIDPASLVGLTVTVADVTGDPGLEVYTAEGKEVDP